MGFLPSMWAFCLICGFLTLVEGFLPIMRAFCLYLTLQLSLLIQNLSLGLFFFNFKKYSGSCAVALLSSPQQLKELLMVCMSLCLLQDILADPDRWEYKMMNFIPSKNWNNVIEILKKSYMSRLKSIIRF